MVRIAFVLALFCLLSPEKEYTMILEMRDLAGGRHEDISEVFSAADDTVAFKQATRRLWMYKTLQRRSNRVKGRNAPEPFAFTLKDSDSSVVQFSPDVAERLVGEDVKLYTQEFIKADRAQPVQKDRELIKVQ